MPSPATFLAPSSSATPSAAPRPSGATPAEGEPLTTWQKLQGWLAALQSDRGDPAPVTEEAPTEPQMLPAEDEPFGVFPAWLNDALSQSNIPGSGFPTSPARTEPADLSMGIATPSGEVRQSGRSPDEGPRLSQAAIPTEPGFPERDLLTGASLVPARVASAVPEVAAASPGTHASLMPDTSNAMGIAPGDPLAPIPVAPPSQRSTSAVAETTAPQILAAAGIVTQTDAARSEPGKGTDWPDASPIGGTDQSRLASVPVDGRPKSAAGTGFAANAVIAGPVTEVAIDTSSRQPGENVLPINDLARDGRSFGFEVQSEAEAAVRSVSRSGPAEASGMIAPPVAAGLAPTTGGDPVPPTTLPRLQATVAEQVATLSAMDAPDAGGDLHGRSTRSTELELAPADLGRLKLVLQTGEKGLQLAVTVERPEMVETVRRHLEGLHRSLIADGIVLDEIDIGTGSGGGSQSGPRNPSPNATPVARISGGEEPDAEPEIDRPNHAPAPGRGRLDLSL